MTYDILRHGAPYRLMALRNAAAAVKAREWVLELISDLRAFRRESTDATAAYNKG